MPVFASPRTSHGRGKPPPLPSWLSGKPVLQWMQIPDTAHMGSAADPTDTGNENSRSNRRLAYCNIATDGGTRVVLAALGGHNDYSGNEVTGIDLGVDAPSWSLLNAKSPTATVNVAYYDDGKPTSRHSYWGTHYSTRKGRLMLHYTRAAWGSAQSFAASNGFNLANSTWDAQGAHANAPGGALCRDVSDNVWAAPSGTQLWRWNAATDTWVQTGTFAAGVYPPMAQDEARGLLFTLAWGDGQGSGSGVTAFRYAANGASRTAITLNSVGGALEQFQADAGNYASMVYDPLVDAFFWWEGAASRLYKIKPNAGTTWDISVVNAAGSAPPARQSAFGRMAYVPPLRGLVFMPSGYGNLYFLKTA